MKFGGYYNDELKLGFNNNGAISFMELKKEARLFSRDLFKSCYFDEAFQYSVKSSED